MRHGCVKQNFYYFIHARYYISYLHKFLVQRSSCFNFQAHKKIRQTFYYLIKNPGYSTKKNPGTQAYSKLTKSTRTPYRLVKKTPHNTPSFKTKPIKMCFN